MIRGEYKLAESTWDAREESAIQRVMRSGRYTMGAEVRQFERELADYLNVRHAVMVNSGSSANLLMVAALVYSGRLKRGATVAVPAVGWSTTYAPLIQFGMRLKVVDVDDTLNIDPSKIGDCDLVMPVNTLGNPCDFDRFPDVPRIVDNCEALGAEYRGREAGTFGLMGSYSFFFAHHICTMEGGAVVTDDDELHELLLMLRAHGWTRDLPSYRGGFHSFEFKVPGFNVRPTEMQGAVGREQLAKLPGILVGRRSNAAVYKTLFGHQREVGCSSWYGFPILPKDRNAALSKLDGVEVRPIVAGNILRHEMLKFAEYESGPTPMADRVHEQGFFIGNHATDLTAQLLYVAERMGVDTDYMMKIVEDAF